MIAIVAEVVGTSFLKASAGFTKPLPSLMVAMGYGAAFYFLSLTLTTIPVGIAHAVWSGVGVNLIAAIGWLFLGQRLDAAAGSPCGRGPMGSSNSFARAYMFQFFRGTPQPSGAGHDIASGHH